MLKCSGILIEVKIIFAEKIEKQNNVIDIYKHLAIYIGGSNLHIGAKECQLLLFKITFH